jgi:hypothetical protein
MEVVKFINKPKYFLGQAIKIFLKDGGAFYLKVTHCGFNWIGGFDDEGIDIQVGIEDIDYIIGG